jgi:hypothetical protein
MKKIFLILMVLFLSCKTNDVQNKQISKSLFGVVFDNKSNPIKHAVIKFRSKPENRHILSVSSDIDGKFIVPELEYGLYLVSVSSTGSLSMEVEVDHYDVSNVLIIKISTFEDLIVKLEKGLKDKNYIHVEERIKQLEGIDGDDVYFNYLKAIFYINTGDYKKAEKILLHLIKKTGNEPFINLLLADLYQYYLEELNKSIIYLEHYADREFSEDVNNRIEELKGVITSTEE